MPNTSPSATGTSNQTRRAYDQVKVLIRSGEIVENEKILEDSLIRSLGITRTAVREALQLLAAEGRVSRQRRAGTLVNTAVLQIPVDDIMPWKASSRLSIERTDYRTVVNTPTIAEHLNIDDEYVGLVEHCFMNGTEAFGVRIAYFRRIYEQPASWLHFPSLAEAFEFVYGSPLTEIRTVVDATACDSATAKLLGIATGSPMLVLEQVLVDGRGLAQEYTFSYYRADSVTFPLAPVRL
ncbi:GntR family transcriptional regulator [Subtercola endophyticus]|uniref:GntR family transcriptional regulator n=1 Tax=Subtercola endophyticus TaxID=2895559 RepID=UPI001E3F7871|nr:GntR family transcriptional regulator [Subtercola endophyticus]UFS57972.1 GntR family transcriptional regulator [Subtercola endophyticus]